MPGAFPIFPPCSRLGVGVGDGQIGPLNPCPERATCAKHADLQGSFYCSQYSGFY